jgi:hypothetical protein
MGVNTTTIHFEKNGVAEQRVLAETFRVGKQDVRIEATGTWKDIVRGTDGENRRVGAATVSVLDLSKGICDFGKLMTTIPNFLNALGTYLAMGRSTLLNTWANWSDGWWKGATTMPYAITCTPSAYKAVKAAFAALGCKMCSLRDKSIKVLTGVQEGTEALGMYAYCATMVAKLFKDTKGFISRCLNFATVAMTVRDGASLTLNLGKLRTINKVDLANAPKTLKDAVREKKTNIHLATAKDVSGVAAGVFGVAALVTGFALPALAAATLALMSASLGAAQHVHKEMMAHDIDVFHGITPVHP